MTGVGDIIVAARRQVRRSPTFRVLLTLLDFLIDKLPESFAASLRRFIFPFWWIEDLKGQSAAWVNQRRPDCRQTMDAAKNAGPVDSTKAARASDLSDSKPQQWGLLLPITSRGSDNIWEQLEATLHKLVVSVPESRRHLTRVHVAIDMQDPELDTERSRERIRTLLTELAGVNFAPPLVPAFQGKICWMWASLAVQAVAAGADFFVLLGDDVIMHDSCWQEDVEEQFEDIALNSGLPFGCACVAIRDNSFPSFPTFPVLHRFHLETFDGKLFPKDFQNQHGDPYLFEIYRRWDASRFTTRSSLTNTVGGFGEARYKKAKGFHWKGDVLSDGIDKLDCLLRKTSPYIKQVICIDVVIPTFRCDLSLLVPLCTLDCKQKASVRTIVVVDNPETENLEAIRGLASYENGRLVRVHVQEANGGASWARNTGLAQSFGDYTVLLDDDVIPETGLLDAYIGAIRRHPDQAAYIGLTNLPTPETWAQCALKACRICYFYGIADLRRNPPWGVTANMCVRSRTISPTFEFFSRAYPRTGGGEDVDFCLRTQAAGHGKLIAVPAAKVLHPYWDAPFKQISGWASGDVLCLSRLPYSTFSTLPNWVEVSLLCLLYAIARICYDDRCAGNADHSSILRTAFVQVALAVLVEVTMLYPRFYLFTLGLPKSRPLVTLLATVPPMLQDLVRLKSKLSRGRVTELCCHMDWMNGTGNHPEETSSNIMWKFVVWLVAVWAVQAESSSTFAGTVLVTLYSIWVLRNNGLMLLDGWKRAITRPPLDIVLEPGVVPFVVLAYQRTGSNMLVRNFLNKHPNMHMHFELFNEKAIYKQSKPGEIHGRIRDIEQLRARDKDPATFLSQTIRESLEVPGCTAVGFKFFPEHVRENEDFLEKLLADPRIRKIVLRRENQLACVTSIMRASVTGEYIHASSDHIPVHLSPPDFQAWTECYDQYYSFLSDRLRGQNYVEITYESLVANPEQTLCPVYKLLGLSDQSSNLPKLKGDLKPQSSGNIRDAVANFGELCGVFASTPRAGDFD